jgi:putative colanic acid biosynthesis UDP-glucose lipid carrier transferase
VYIALPPRAEPRIAALIRRLADTTASVYLAYDFGGFDLLRAQWSSVGEIPVMGVVENPFYGSDGMLKRIEDIVVGAGILVLISLPMALIALGIKLTSKGPVFFQQRRYGLNGEEIRVLKFRTMTVCEDGDKVVQAQRGDQRITAFGALLRRTSLDELPQFLQVVGGTMSIVGPRPHAVAHNEQYRSLIQGYMLRHKVKPGITGWAQVNGWRGETDTLEKMQKRVEYDLEYIRNWKLGFDFKIILMTVRQVLGGHDNAY